MKYEIFKKQLCQKAYFEQWTDKNYQDLTKELRNRIYQKYLVKCQVFNRDNFECQNLLCKKTDSPLTFHHVKWQKNGGEDKTRNGISLCKSCHNRYHKAKGAISFANNKLLPPHIRGHTFKLDKPDKFDWKKNKSDMKKLRKSLKQHCGYVLSLDQVKILMPFLDLEFDC